jgi:trigger factor
MLREQLSAVQQNARGGNEQEQLERYLQQMGKTEEELIAEMRPLAESRIRRSLVLSEVGEAEHIEVADEEVETEIERLSSGVGEQADELRRIFSNEGAKENLRRSLTTKKTLDRLVELASSDGEEPAVEQEENKAQASASQNE